MKRSGNILVEFSINYSIKGPLLLTTKVCLILNIFQFSFNFLSFCFNLQNLHFSLVCFEVVCVCMFGDMVQRGV